MLCTRCHERTVLHPRDLTPGHREALRRALGAGRAAALAEVLDLLRGDLCVQCLTSDPVLGPRYRAARQRAIPFNTSLRRAERAVRGQAGRVLDYADGLVDRLRRRRRPA